MNRPTLEDLLETPAKVAELSSEELPVLLAQVAALQSNLAARLLKHPARPTDPLKIESTPDRWLNANEAAPLLGVTPRWLYRHWKQLPFARKLSRKVLQFSENGIRHHSPARVS